jgi:hypothetical protein
MTIFTKLLNSAPASRVRRNHGLEHATMNVLAAKHPRASLAGHSDLNGFWLVGEVSTEEVAEAVFQALARMKEGEHELAIHANCGTNFVAVGLVAGVAAWLGMLGVDRGFRKKLERLPIVISLTTLAMIFAQPLGPILQERVTTSGEPGELQVTQIIATHQGPFMAHHIITKG